MAYSFNSWNYESLVISADQAEERALKLWQDKSSDRPDSKYPFLLGSVLQQYKMLYEEFKKLEEAYKELQEETKSVTEKH